MKTQRKNTVGGCLRLIIMTGVVLLIVVQFPRLLSRTKPEKEVGKVASREAASRDISAADEENRTEEKDRDLTAAREIVAGYAEKNGLSTEEWPEKLIELLGNNPETEEFVLNYPLKKDAGPDADLSEYKNCDTVPLLMQWDERWGYSQYGDQLMGISGCGPACLSMVCLYVLQDVKYTPRYVAEFAERNGYYVDGSGSAWSLIYEGGEQLGLDVEELPLDETQIARNLKEGNPVICIMRPGDFTTSGHFIVLTDYIDGKLKVNDPNSRLRSEKLWRFEDIRYQIRNLWVCKAK